MPLSTCSCSCSVEFLLEFKIALVLKLAANSIDKLIINIKAIAASPFQLKAKTPNANMIDVESQIEEMLIALAISFFII